MNKTKEFKVAEGLTVQVLPDEQEEFLMTTSEVAKGFGVSSSNLRKHKSEHLNELVEGKHFVTGVTNSNDPSILNSYNASKQTLWTKRGIVRLGFFIKSERAKMFRDWAEDLVITVTDQVQKSEQLAIWPEPKKGRYNRLTPKRMISILADVAKIEDKELRLSLVNKLMEKEV